MDLSYLTTEICKIVKEGGTFLENERKKFKKNQIEEKGVHNYVTNVDKKSEKRLTKQLSALIPEASFITEEGTMIYQEADYCWIIDPLDGTTNFIYDNTPYCISIALTYQSEPLIGVVYEVGRKECFYAWKNGGAFMNGTPIHVSADIKEISSASIGLGLPYSYQEFKPVIIPILEQLYGEAASIRINGSAAISICYVAIGRYDAWGEAFIQPWDFMAGTLIVREAGGKVTNFKGEEDIWDNHHIIASNHLLHEKMIHLFSNNSF